MRAASTGGSLSASAWAVSRAMIVRAGQRLSTKRATSCGRKMRASSISFSFAGGPSVERRRLRRDQDEIGGKQRRAHQTGDARRPVDNDVVGIAGEFGRLQVQRIAGKADDAEQPWPALLQPLLGPVERRALRIGVDQGDALSFPGPFAGEMQRERRLADAAFLVEERDDHRSLLRAFHRLRRSPTTEGLDSSRLESKLVGSESVDRLDEFGCPGS